MKILLCSMPSMLRAHLGHNPNAGGELPVLPKTAVVCLMRYLFENGFPRSDCEFLDIDMLAPTDDELFRYFQEIKPDIIGFSAVTSGAYANSKDVAAIAKRACPNAFLILGGALSASANVILRKTQVDMCVVGDGEIALHKLVTLFQEQGISKDLEGLQKIKGLAYLNRKGELIFNGYGERLHSEEMNLTADYEILRAGLRGKDHLLRNYFRRGKYATWFRHDPRAHERGRRPNIASMNTAKGCVAKCTFCQRATKGYRRSRIDIIEESLLYLIKHHDVGFLHVTDENFGSDTEQAMEFAALMKKHDVLWAATGVRCDSVTRDIVKAYADNNCVALKFGVESGSQKILNIMEKKFTKEQVKRAVGWCQEFGLYSPLAIMFGMPGETMETATETGQFIADIALQAGTEPADDGDVFYAIPFPGTPLYEYGQQLGIIGKTVDEEEQFLLDLFQAPTYKLSYVNLNGAPLSEVLFWDVLAELELRRHYYANKGKVTPTAARVTNRVVPASDKLVDAAASTDALDIPTPQVDNRLFSSTFPAPTARVQHKRIFDSSILQIIKRRIRTGRWRESDRTVNYISRFLRLKVAPSYWATRIPRFILYPTIRALLMLEFYAGKYATRHLDLPYFKTVDTYGRVPRVTDDYHKSFDKKVVSVRSIVVKHRPNPTDLSEQNRLKLLIGL